MFSRACILVGTRLLCRGSGSDTSTRTARSCRRLPLDFGVRPISDSALFTRTQSLVSPLLRPRIPCSLVFSLGTTAVLRVTAKSRRSHRNRPSTAFWAHHRFVLYRLSPKRLRYKRVSFRQMRDKGTADEQERTFTHGRVDAEGC